MNFRLGLWLVVSAFAGLWSGCSSFDQRWQEAASKPAAERWDGRWVSGKHLKGSGQPEGGRLRAVTEPGVKGALDAHFHANWIVFSSDYSMTFQRKPGPQAHGQVEYRGTHDLPKLFGGTYRYEAVRQGDRLTAKYDSSYDHGTFELHKVPPAAAKAGTR